MPRRRVRVLVTNDDSHRSPLLVFLLDALEAAGASITVVVPAHEQSWRGKGITRFGSLHVSTIEIAGKPCFAIDGTPADCANIGIYHLCPEKPHLIVSGINAGLNASAAFILSSGTVGACLEANIAQIPAVAFSQAFDSETMSRYVADYALPDATVERLRAQTKLLMSRLLPLCLSPRIVEGDAITWNINFPFMVREGPAVQVCPLSSSRYGSCFMRSGDSFSHHLQDLVHDERSDVDTSLLRDGVVTVTPIDARRIGMVGERQREMFQALLAAAAPGEG